MEFAILNKDRARIVRLYRISCAVDLFSDFSAFDGKGSILRSVYDSNYCVKIWEDICQDVLSRKHGYVWLERDVDLYVFGVNELSLAKGIGIWMVSKIKSENKAIYVDQDYIYTEVLLRRRPIKTILDKDYILFSNALLITNPDYSDQINRYLLLNKFGVFDQGKLGENHEAYEMCNFTREPIYPYSSSSAALIPSCEGGNILHENNVCEYLMKWWRNEKHKYMPRDVYIYLTDESGRRDRDYFFSGVHQFTNIISREESGRLINFIFLDSD